MDHLFAGDAYDQVKEIFLGLPTEQSLPNPELALAVYVQSPGSNWEYRGAVNAQRPSAVIPLVWPPSVGGAQAADGTPLPAQIGISIESTASLPAAVVGTQQRAEEFARKVGENLFHFMQSFSSSSDGMLHVPVSILNQWFTKFQERFRVDPDFLDRQRD